MPSPRASPLTNWVLPAPRSPESPSTQPFCAARPKRLPRASVSAGLCEMSVAMLLQRAHSGFVADADSFLGRNFADAGQLHLRELLFPGVQQWDGIAAGDGEQEFEILAVGQRGQESRLSL